MWDWLVLTAGSERQKKNFEILLAEVDTKSFCRRVIVIADYPPSAKIGSGGATLNVLRSIEAAAIEQKVLLIHSGGLSQRTPHLSAFGKIFATLPNGTTVLEAKLQTYRSLSISLPAGVLICASDVLEDVHEVETWDSTTDMILFATESNLEVAKNHGVFVLNDGQLERVLQKPSKEVMEAAGAILPSGNALTDCKAMSAELEVNCKAGWQSTVCLLEKQQFDRLMSMNGWTLYERLLKIELNGSSVVQGQRTSAKMRTDRVRQYASRLSQIFLELRYQNAYKHIFSFFWISWSLCAQLVSLWEKCGPCVVELCCYGDFMRPLGHKPLLDYLKEGGHEMSQWRVMLANVFSKVSPKVINLGVETFFHVGTSREIQEHYDPESIFSKKFLGTSTNAVHCQLTNTSVDVLLVHNRNSSKTLEHLLSSFSFYPRVCSLYIFN